MKFLAILLWVMVAAVAQAAEKAKGLAFDAALGLPSAEIKNPDDSSAFYSGLSLTGRLHLPVMEIDNFRIDLMGSARYVDLKNTINNSTQKEIGQHIGPGVGIELRAYKFIVGAEYYFMLARHYTVGQFSEELEFSMPTTNIYGGLAYQFGQLSLEVTYSQGSGKVPKTKTLFQNDSPYTDQVYWVHLKYSTGYSLGQFLSALFK